MLERYQFMRLAGITYGTKRDTYEVLGYQRDLTTKDYRDRYARGGIAGRVVDALPKATWRSDVWIEENDNPDKLTVLEQQWEDLYDQFDLQNLFLRVDILSQLSTYAVLLIGAPGNLDEELPRGKPGGVFTLTPFSGGGGPGVGDNRIISNLEGDATIAELELDTTNVRFGLPRLYQLKRIDTASAGYQRPVHWSRVIHIAENCLDNEVYGQPSLERVWNLLDDLDKITGGGSEASWINANKGLHLNVDKDIKDLTEPEKKDLALQADEYQHQIRRMIRTRGVDVTPLGTDVAQFGPNADAILTQIAGAKSIPKRILTGSEMGELASSQDRDNWRDQIVGRQEGYAGPKVVRRLVQRLIDYGYLAASKKYDVRWSPINTRTEDEKASGSQRWAAVNKTQGEVVFTNDEIRDYWYGKQPLTDEEKVLPVAPAAPVVPTEDVEEQIKLKAAESSEDSELVEILVEALETGNLTVVNQLIALGGQGSGNFGHEGRPGEVGGSAPGGGISTTGSYGPKDVGPRLQDTKLYTPATLKMIHKEHADLSPENLEKIHKALHQIDHMLDDPDIGVHLWGVLSSFTPEGLKERLAEFHTHGTTSLPVKKTKRAAAPSVDSQLKKIFELMLDPDIGPILQKIVLRLR